MATRGAFLPAKAARVLKLTTYLHLVPRVKMSGAILPFPQMPSQRVFGKLVTLSFT
jgi:hypothetical protein